MKLVTQVKSLRSGDRLLETRLYTRHPDLPDYYKEYYTLCKSKWKSDQYSSKIVLHYSCIKKQVKDYFAQILKHGTDDNHFVVVYRVGCLLESTQASVQSEQFKSFSSARAKYKSVFDEVVMIESQDPTHYTEISDLISLHPPTTLFLDADDDAEAYFGQSYRKYDEFDDDMKDFVKLFITDFTQSTTMKSMRNDLSRTAVGYPSLNAIFQAFHWMRFLEQTPRATPSSSSTYFYLFIPAYCEKDQELPGINSITMINEKLQLLKALQSKSYRDELTLPYPERVDLLLRRLQYPLVVMDRKLDLVQGILSCIENTGAESVKPPHYLTLVNVYEFDTSSSIVIDDVTNNNVLLWHGTDVGSVNTILQNGLQPATPGFGAGIYLYDTVAKPALYCHDDSPDVVLLLCEVQLGRSKIVSDADSEYSAAPKGFDSVTAIGNRSTGDRVYDSYGNTLKCGNLEVNSSVSCARLTFNEFVVYQSSQVKVRYLVHVNNQ